MNRTAPDPARTVTITVHGRRVAASLAVVTALAAGYAAGASGATVDPSEISVQEQIDAGGVWGGGMGPVPALVSAPGGGVFATR